MWRMVALLPSQSDRVRPPTLSGPASHIPDWHTEGLLLCRAIVVLKQLIMDEPNSRPVEPELLYEFVSMVLCTLNARLVGLTVDAFQPLVHLEHFA